MTAEANFWEMVKTDTPPAVDGTVATTETIKTVYSESDDSICDLTTFSANLRQYIELKNQINDLESIANEIANKIKVFMEESSSGFSDDYKVSWKTQTRRTFDWKHFAKENPNVDISGFFKQTVSRPFSITKIN